MFQARLRVTILAAADIAAMLAAAWIAEGLRRFFLSASFSFSPGCFLAAPLFFFFAVFIRLYHGNLFNPGFPLSPPEELRRIFFADALACGVLGCQFLAAGVRTTELLLPLLFIFTTALPLVLLFRGLARGIMKRGSFGQIPVLIAGCGRAGRSLAFELRRNPYFGLDVRGFLDDRPGPEVLGPLSDVVRIGGERRIPMLFICLPPEKARMLLRGCINSYRSVLVLFQDRTLPVSWSYPVMTSRLGGLQFQNQMLLFIPRLLKRMLEFFLAVFAVFILWPVILLIAVLIKLTSPGPVFYSAKRIGADRKAFRIWKFRTMYWNSDHLLEKILAEDPDKAREWREKFKLENDPRITPLGRILRRTSLDELPQLLNVLRGEMAMIGPRPIVPAEIAYYGDDYADFSTVKPGITGLWQVSGRSDLSYEERAALDMYYIYNWSVWLDLHILIRTFAEVFSGRGAR